jgi:hypothetical protein
MPPYIDIDLFGKRKRIADLDIKAAVVAITLEF